DYITVRVASGGLPLLIQGGMLVRVHGYLQSRYYAETLGDWLKDAKGPTNALSVSDELRATITHNRVVTEIVAEKVVLDAPETRSARNGKDGKPAAELEAQTA